MKRQPIRKERGALVPRIVCPHFVEYKYARPTRWKQPGDCTTEPYVRRPRSSYLRFILNF